MSEPRRLVESDAVPPGLESSARVLRQLPAPETPPRARLDATWDAVLARSVVGIRRSWAWSLVPAAAAVAALVLFVIRTPEVVVPQAEQPSPASFVAIAGAQVEPATAAAPARVLLGQVRGRTVASGAEERLASPHGTVAWRAARFLLDVNPERTLLHVEEGEVRWRSPLGERILHAGAELRAPPLVPALPPSSECPVTPVDARVQCLERLGEGGGLAAQNALFELGWVELHQRGAPEAALGRWEVYLARFPGGSLEAEARALRILTLAEQGRVEDARGELERFRRELPEDPLLAPLSGLKPLWR